MRASSKSMLFLLLLIVCTSAGLTISCERPGRRHIGNPPRANFGTEASPFDLDSLRREVGVDGSSPPDGETVGRVRQEGEGPCNNARVNVNAETVSQPQFEPSVASNPNDPLQLVVGYADHFAELANAPGVSRSIDGGQTWIAPDSGPNLPNPPGFVWGNLTVAEELGGGDPAITWGLGNTVYYSTLGRHSPRDPPNNDCSRGGLYVYRSDDSGATWTLPANGPAIHNTQNISRDKEYIAADANPTSPFAGNLYMAWNDFDYVACPHVNNENVVHVKFSVSTDGAATWSEPLTMDKGFVLAPVPAVAANGDVFLVWNIGIDADDFRLMVSKSIDGGNSFGPAMAIASDLSFSNTGTLPGTDFKFQSFPSIATDPTNPDHVYVTWSSGNGDNQNDVFLSRSLDGGDTWSAEPLRVNDDGPGTPRDQFFPWVAVSGEGIVRVMWGDDRLDLVNEGGKLYDVFMAESFDQGASFEPNIRVTTVSSNPDFDGFGGGFIGDYWGLSASGVAVWGDTRDLNQNIYAGSCGARPCPATHTPSAELIAGEVNTKNRFLSFSVGEEGQSHAVAITFASLPPPFDIWDGVEMWVGPTSLVSENGATVTPIPDFPNFPAATLQCEPHFEDFGALGVVHVFHEGIVPEGDYRIRAINQACDMGAEFNFSSVLPLKTSRWADTVRDFTTDPPGPSDNLLNIIDALAVINRLISAPTAIIKARADLEPGCIDLTINITDVLATIMGFQGLGYPFEPTADDPCESTCINPLP